MVDKILQMSAFEKYDFELKLEKLAVKQEIEAVLYSLKGRMDKFGIRLNTELIEISDTGIGIPKEHIQKVFESFYTVDKIRARENGGAGLGLSLARKRAESMGGAIVLLNTGFEGSSFRITFPVVI